MARLFCALVVVALAGLVNASATRPVKPQADYANPVELAKAFPPSVMAKAPDKETQLDVNKRDLWARDHLVGKSVIVTATVRQVSEAGTGYLVHTYSADKMQPPLLEWFGWGMQSIYFDRKDPDVATLDKGATIRVRATIASVRTARTKRGLQITVSFKGNAKLVEAQSPAK